MLEIGLKEDIYFTMAIDKRTRFSKTFEKIWDKYLDRNATDIILVGKKSPNMTQVPIFNVTGAFSGWNEKDMSKNELIDFNSILKIKIVDLQNTYSQEDVMKGSGKSIIESVNENSYTNEDALIFDNLNIGGTYVIQIEYRFDGDTRMIKAHNERGMAYNNFIINNTDGDTIELRIIATGRHLYLDCRGIGGDFTVSKSTIGKPDGSVQCPILNLKSSIDYITVGDRTFKINSQQLSASNTLTVLELVNII